MHVAEFDDRIGVVTGLLDHLAARRMHRRLIFGIDHSAGHLERELRDAVTPLANHHDVAIFRERNDIHPIGRLKDEEVALAAPRMRRAAAMGIENRRAVRAVAFERLPLPRLHLTTMPADVTWARIRLRRRDRRAMRSAAEGRPRPTRIFSP